MSPDYKYRAFISYSHRDKEWGEWFHSNLERYRVPRDLVGRDTEFGPIPANLRPIFRDREDLSAAHSIDARLAAALAASSHLIVLCSPGSVQSAAVNEEIRHFKAAGKGDRILPVIVGGEPHHPDLECFPRALLNTVDADGRITDERDIEPIAADARPEGDGRELAKLKLVGGLLGLELDEIRRRDLAEQLRQKRVWQGISAVMGLLAIAAAWNGVKWHQAYTAHDALLQSTRAHLERTLEQGSHVVDSVAAMNEEFGVPLAAVEEFMGDTRQIIVDAEEFLSSKVPVDDLPADLRRARGRSLISFARTASKSSGSSNNSAKAEKFARDAIAIFTYLSKLEGAPQTWHHERTEAEVELASALNAQGKVPEALETFKAACGAKDEIVKVMWKEPPYWARWRRALADCRMKEGQALNKSGASDRAGQSFKKAMEQLRPILAENPNDQASTFLAIDVLRTHATVQLSQKKLEQALEMANEATKLGERASAANPGSLKLRRGLALAMQARGDVFNDKAQYDRALENYAPARDIYQDLVRIDPENWKYQSSYAYSLYKIGNARRKLPNRDKDADASEYETGRQIYERLVANEPANHFLKSNLSDVLNGIAEVHLERKQINEAIAIRRKQIALFDGVPSLRPNVSYARQRLGDLFASEGRHRDALGEYETALALRRQVLEINPSDANSQMRVGELQKKIAEEQGALDKLASEKSGTGEPDAAAPQP